MNKNKPLKGVFTGPEQERDGVFLNFGVTGSVHTEGTAIMFHPDGADKDVQVMNGELFFQKSLP